MLFRSILSGNNGRNNNNVFIPDALALSKFEILSDEVGQMYPLWGLIPMLVLEHIRTTTSILADNNASRVVVTIALPQSIIIPT